LGRGRKEVWEEGKKRGDEHEFRILLFLIQVYLEFCSKNYT